MGHGRSPRGTTILNASREAVVRIRTFDAEMELSHGSGRRLAINWSRWAGLTGL